MYLRSFENKDYKLFCKWSKKLDLIPPPLCVLPFGVIAIDRKLDEPIGCCFMYFSENTPVAVIEWLTLNPDAKPKKRLQSINAMYNFLELIAKEHHHTYIMTGSNVRSIVNSLTKNNYMLANGGFAHLVKVLEDK